MKPDRIVRELQSLQKDIFMVANMSSMQREAIGEAAKIVKKEIPSKPDVEITKEHNITIYVDVLCPNCKEIFDDGVIESKAKRCPNCGQVLRWEDD